MRKTTSGREMPRMVEASLGSLPGPRQELLLIQKPTKPTESRQKDVLTAARHSELVQPSNALSDRNRCPNPTLSSAV